MELVQDIAALRERIARWRREDPDGRVGFVPTMGYLHEGHLSLIRRARAECRRVVVSVFVNPLQFGPQEDFARYPRDLERDLRLAAGAGADLLFHPPVEAMYPHGDPGVFVDVGDLARRWEGARRPGHFRGVVTVVTKLFHLVQPDRAYFGQKDAQQAVIVRRMVADLNFPLEVVVCPTVREPDGLAMSSRNVYLDEDQRRAAPILYRALQAARRRLEAGERSGPALVEAMEAVLGGQPLIDPEYAAVVDAATLEPLERVEGEVLLLVAARLGSTRLIDNLWLVVEGDRVRDRWT
ncbi:pantothenate synthetase [Thermaerobacter marianensis DSM 12885]|uniref:Pantothenate synthetase n=1 Tax=Thermaerobacter marianensis (strain ATCC 700841 / DSM 12885 / JCM 10246 / 7p75a) TaxID=644966 RepID=E6SG80_THEM7|nr:pantoate--beta-alanine ligase [Thermaerobacter marianensis]ADU50497.1 pantothenate synthetase [Thermaerobacter marianensis DSM 12885]